MMRRFNQELKTTFNPYHNDDNQHVDIIRQCIACRSLRPRNEMLRLTWSRQDNQFTIDSHPPRQGRSAYVCRKTVCLAEAIKGKKFQRTLKRAIPDDIVETLNDQLKGITS